jgi:hypothetical protein
MGELPIITAIVVLVGALSALGAALLGIACALTFWPARKTIEPTGQGVVFREGRFVPTRTYFGGR